MDRGGQIFDRDAMLKAKNHSNNKSKKANKNNNKEDKRKHQTPNTKHTHLFARKVLGQLHHAFAALLLVLVPARALGLQQLAKHILEHILELVRRTQGCVCRSSEIQQGITNQGDG